MSNYIESSSQRNIVIRTVENNRVMKWSGVSVAELSLLDILVKGNGMRAEDQHIVAAVGIFGVVAAALGEVLSKTNS